MWSIRSPVSQRATRGSNGLHVHRIEGDALEVDRVLLATGYSRERPGGALVDDLVASAGLRCAPCGYPMVDRALRWHRRIHVSGPLAELELGPVARNIAGARRAGDRIAAWAASGPGRVVPGGAA